MSPPTPTSTARGGSRRCAGPGAGLRQVRRWSSELGCLRAACGASSRCPQVREVLNAERWAWL